MPECEPQTMSGRDLLIEKLMKILPQDSLIIACKTGRRAFVCDAFTMYRALPLVVVLPETVEQVQAITGAGC